MTGALVVSALAGLAAAVWAWTAGPAVADDDERT